jgi:guanyl-specific ribonuclease Sa
MSKINKILLAAVLTALFTGFSGAAAAAAGLKPAANDASVLSLLTSLAPSREIMSALAVQNVKAAPASLETAKAIEPGSDLSPKVEDPVRVKAILKLVSDVYNNVQLPYSQDGSTFTNKEKVLPPQPLGFYKEYTLITGNAPHTVVIGGQTYQVAPDQGKRGSERVVIGGGEELYYTPDHYARFIELTVVR